jgi:hypothetical protein
MGVRTVLAGEVDLDAGQESPLTSIGYGFRDRSYMLRLYRRPPVHNTL